MALRSARSEPRGLRGRVLDALVCVMHGALLASSFGRSSGAPDPEALEPSFRWVLLAALLAYTLGAALKRTPFQARVPALDAPAHAGCLCAAWLVLHLALGILAAASCVAEASEVPLALRVAAMIALSVLPTTMAVRLLVRPSRATTPAAWRVHPLTEGVADLLIGAAVLFGTWFWNEQVAGLFYADFPGASFGDRLIGAVLATGSFAMFYVAPRFLFLLEDHARWGTWISMGATLLPMLARFWL